MERRFGTLLACIIFALGVACGGEEPTKPDGPGKDDPDPQVGTLRLRLEGVPVGVGAGIEVSGPEGFETTVDEPQLLEELVPGTYVVTARELEDDAFHYFPSPDTAEVEVKAGEVAVHTISYSKEALEPFSLFSEGVVIPLHSEGNLVVSLLRNGDFAEAVNIRLEGVPLGIIPTTATIAPGSSSATLRLISDGTARQMGPREIQVIGEAGPESVRTTATLSIEPTVDNLDDSGPGSLRYYVDLAPNLETVEEDADVVIGFAPDLQGTISLGSSLVAKSTTIVRGPPTTGEPRVELRGNESFQLVTVEEGVKAEFSNLAFAKGSAQRGGAIENLGTLRLENTLFMENQANFTGGAITNHDTLEVSNSIFRFNGSDLGGAIANFGEATIEESVFENNQGNLGGAIANGEELPQAGASPHLVLTETSFIENEAARAAAILNHQGTMEVTGGEFEGNTALEDGGAIAIDYIGSATIADATFHKNTATDFGGAIYVAHSAEPTTTTLGVFRTTFTENSGSHGGAIMASNAILDIDRGTFQSNKATENGGGVAIEAGGSARFFEAFFELNTAKLGAGIHSTQPLEVVASTLDQNKASGHGGGIHTSADTLVFNSTLTANEANSNGGALLITDDGVLTVIHATLAKNKAGGPGGGIHNTAEIEVGRSIFWDNEAQGGRDIITPEGQGVATSLDYNILQSSASSGMTLLGKDLEGAMYNPSLLPLGPNQGWTPTMMPNAASGSPAIDHIPAADCKDPEGLPLNVDQRGAPRPVGDGCDVGAYEVQ